MAYICRLYSYQIKEKQVWETIYKLAKKVSNHKYQVLGNLLLYINYIYWALKKC